MNSLYYEKVIQDRIRKKLVEAGATSLPRAVTVKESNLDVQEQNWLTCIAGGLFSGVKKTKDKRYYVSDWLSLSETRSKEPISTCSLSN
jgi:hypothetical protein